MAFSTLGRCDAGGRRRPARLFTFRYQRGSCQERMGMRVFYFSTRTCDGPRTSQWHPRHDSGARRSGGSQRQQLILPLLLHTLPVQLRPDLRLRNLGVASADAARVGQLHAGVPALRQPAPVRAQRPEPHLRVPQHRLPQVRTRRAPCCLGSGSALQAPEAWSGSTSLLNAR